MSKIKISSLIAIIGSGTCIGTTMIPLQNNFSSLSPTLNTLITNIYVYGSESDVRSVDFNGTDYGDGFWSNLFVGYPELEPLKDSLTIYGGNIATSVTAYYDVEEDTLQDLYAAVGLTNFTNFILLIENDEIPPIPPLPPDPVIQTKADMLFLGLGAIFGLLIGIGMGVCAYYLYSYNKKSKEQ